MICFIPFAYIKSVKQSKKLLNNYYLGLYLLIKKVNVNREREKQKSLIKKRDCVTFFALLKQYEGKIAKNSNGLIVNHMIRYTLCYVTSTSITYL